jgi:hypothetical protein
VTLPNVPIRTVEFSYLDGLEVHIRPAVLDLNPLYLAACQTWLSPLKLAGLLPEGHPRALTEKRAVAGLAKCYAMAVCAGSNVDEMDAWQPDQWEAWLLEHPDEFESLRTVAPVRTNFVPEDDPRPPGAVGDVLATPDPSAEMETHSSAEGGT